MYFNMVIADHKEKVIPRVPIENLLDYPTTSWFDNFDKIPYSLRRAYQENPCGISKSIFSPNRHSTLPPTMADHIQGKVKDSNLTAQLIRLLHLAH